MASFGAAPHNGLEASRQLAHPDDHSDENSNFNNSVSTNGGVAQYTNYANFYTDNPYATVVSAIELGPNDMPKGKNKPARVWRRDVLYNLIMKHVNVTMLAILFY